ncbi:MAG: AMP-binding protein [Acidimicrobiia bacterium]|nr:AMP-binding protein [Acidimicrobiia bacterium]
MSTTVDLEAHGLLSSPARPEIPGGPQTVVEVLDRPVAEHPGREALVGRYSRYTYAQLDEAADRAAHALAGLGVGPGDRVAGSLPNHPDIVVAFLGVMRLGAIWLGVPKPLAPPEKAYLLRDGGASVLIAEPAAAAELEPLRGELPSLRHVVRAEPAGSEGARPGEPGADWAALLASAATGRPDVPVDPFAPAAIAYTSGTTGFPKGAVHSQHNLVLPGAVARTRGNWSSAGVQGVALPLTILNLIVLTPLVCFQAGATCVTMDRVDALGMADWIRRERIETFGAVPAMIYDLLTHPEVRDEDLASLTRPGVGAADCPQAFRDLYRERFGTEVTFGYGLTEAPTAVTNTDPDGPQVPGSSGTALPQVRMLVVDEDDRELPPGEVGEICVAPAEQGPWAGVYTTMLGYWNKPEATAKALRDGFLHTGDLGYLDERGHLFVKDRRNDLIVRGGANVYPAEVERVLHDDGRVAACAVVGRPDERLGERVVAFVQLAPGVTASAEELATHCAANLARYKVPEELVFVDELPRNAMGKVRKTVLRDRLAATGS